MMGKGAIQNGHVPFVRMLIAWVGGILMGSGLWASAGMIFTLYSVSIALYVLFFLLFFFLTRYKIPIRGWLGSIWLLFLFFSGALSIVKTDPRVQKTHFSHFKSTALEGVVQEIKKKDAAIQLSLSVRKAYTSNEYQPVTGNLQVTVRASDTALELQYGDVVLIPPSYSAIPPPYNPEQFDYQRYMWSHDTHHQLFIEAHQVKMLRSGEGNGWIAQARALREHLIHRLDQYLDDPEAMGIASALVFGERAYLDPEVQQTFSKTGTIHVLAVSGLHVGMVFLVGSFLLSWMGNGRYSRIVKIALLFACIWGYALLTGFSPSVLRAAIMLSFVIVGLHFRKANIYNVISASAMLLLFYNPKFLFHIGFQLSYGAVLGIVYFYPKIKRWLPTQNPILSWVWNAAAVSLSAQIAVSPWIMYYFDNFPLYFLPANLFILLPATCILYGGFLLALLPDGGVAHTLGAVYAYGITFCKNVLEWMEKWPYASMDIYIPLSQVLLLGLLFIWGLWNRRQKILKFHTYIFASLFIYLIGHQALKIKNSYTTEVRLYNVYNHLAIGLFSAKETLVYSDLPSIEEGRLSYMVYPHLKRMGRQARLLAVEKSYQSASARIEQGLIQWANCRLLIYDGSRQYDRPIQMDILLIRSNAIQSFADIPHQWEYRQVVLDGSNSDKIIERFSKEAQQKAQPLYILKNNFSYVWRR